MVAPLTKSGAEPPKHSVVSFETITLGNENTLMFTVSVPIQPLPSVPVTTYIVDEVGVEIGVCEVLLSRKLVGDQAYETPPVADNCTGCTAHRVVSFSA